MRLVLTGDKFFLDRYRGLVPALSRHVASVEVLPSGNIMELWPVRVAAYLARGTPHKPRLDAYLSSWDRRAGGYELRSRQTEWKIAKLATRPDFVLHLFSSFGPFLKRKNIPYGMYLDFTMAMANRQWKPWAKFPNEREFQAWIAAESRSYERAAVLFTMGANAKASLVADYGVPENKIEVVGSGGDFDKPHDKPKTNFGAKQILFQGSEFERKGGDILLAAFRWARQEIPDAKLVIIGSALSIDEPGVSNLGYVSRERVQDLFLGSDLVVAPARCDPFTAFVIEAMNYGVPCVVSKASGVSEALTHGVDGVVVDHSDPRAVANAIVQLLGTPELLERISINARELVRARLNWDVVGACMAAGIQTRAKANPRV